MEPRTLSWAWPTGDVDGDGDGDGAISLAIFRGRLNVLANVLRKPAEKIVLEVRRVFICDKFIFRNSFSVHGRVEAQARGRQRRREISLGAVCHPPNYQWQAGSSSSSSSGSSSHQRANTRTAPIYAGSFCGACNAFVAGQHKLAL
jgi:hypothetical protein